MSEPLTPERLAEVSSTLAESPWHWNSDDQCCRLCCLANSEGRGFHNIDPDHYPDLRLVADALNAFPSLRAEVDRLTRWKSEATEVLAEWEKAWVAAGEPGLLGESKARATAAEVDRLRAQAAGLDEALAVAAQEIDQRDRWLAEVRAQAAALTSALERTETNFRSAVRGLPVRDMSENLAENRAALAFGDGHEPDCDLHRPHTGNCSTPLASGDEVQR